MTVPASSPSEPVRSRRALLAAATGGVLAAVAGALGRPVPATASHLMGFGHANAAGAANTSLTTSSTGTALLVTQNGSGTALRGSAVGAGSIGGFFTASNGTGISGVTGHGDRYGVYGGNDAASAGMGAAIRANGQESHGLVATTHGVSGIAVKGVVTAGAGTGVFGQGFFGVWGESVTQLGVYGHSTSGFGVAGLSTSGGGVSGGSQSGYGVRADSISGVGLYAESDSNDAVLGSINTGFKSAIVGANPHADGWAGYFEGNVVVTGTYNGAAGLSAIDHPLDPANQTLAHAFIGSPDMKNVYDGTVTLDAGGQASVSLPSYFEALNTTVRYQLTAIGRAAPDLHVAAKVNNGAFRIGGGQPGMEVSWQVTGVRRDAYAAANPIAVEAHKPADRRGRYLNPLAHGQAASKGWKDLPKPQDLPERPIQPAP